MADPDRVVVGVTVETGVLVGVAVPERVPEGVTDPEQVTPPNAGAVPV